MAPTGKSRRGPRAITTVVPKGTIKIYANARVADALEQLTAEMTLYHGVKLGQVIDAVYQQGVRDGRREVFERLERLESDPGLRHRNPGRPRRRP
jgi:hypothetical protein